MKRRGFFKSVAAAAAGVDSRRDEHRIIQPKMKMDQ